MKKAISVLCAILMITVLAAPLRLTVKAEEKMFTFEELVSQDKVKIQGRHTPGLATAYWSGNSVEMNVELTAPTMTFNIVTAEPVVYFEFFVDGKSVRRTSVTPQNKQISLNGLVTAGKHNVRAVRETGTEKTGVPATYFESVILDGEILERPADNKLLIEIIGDSISCGLGSLGSFVQGTAWRVEDHSATHSFGYRVAEDLGADYSIVASGGVGLYGESTGKQQNLAGVKTTIQEMYEYVNGVPDYGNENAKYKPTRVPDLIIMRIGANDDKQNEVLWKQELVKFVNRIKEINGAEIPILFSGETGKDHLDTVRAAKNNELKDYPLYLKSFTLGRSGSAALATQTSGHPNAKEQRDLSLALLEAIEIYHLDVPLSESAKADAAEEKQEKESGGSKTAGLLGIAGAAVAVIAAAVTAIAVKRKKKKAPAEEAKETQEEK